MLSWIKASILILLLLLSSSSSGSADHGLGKGVKMSTYSDLEAMIQMKARKLIGVEALLDYQEPIANPAHEPKKGTPGGKG